MFETYLIGENRILECEYAQRNGVCMPHPPYGFPKASPDLRAVLYSQSDSKSSDGLRAYKSQTSVTNAMDPFRVLLMMVNTHIIHVK